MKRVVKIIIFIVIAGLVIHLLYAFNIIPHGIYDSAYFNIETYHSDIDKDNDGKDDQQDILDNARAYVATKPQYESKYYSTGYSNDEYGVCSDVVAVALRDAGYDLRELVNEDILNHPGDYDIEKVDKNIDFRRVANLKVYFKNNALSLTTDIYDTSSWQGGDIVIFNHHIGIVSDKRNRKGITLVIHHASRIQREYEEDILEARKNSIVGHYRMS